MTPPLAHIAGLPIEESLLPLLPAAGLLLLGARLTLTRISRRLDRRTNRKPTTRSGPRR
jgi:hypothetical protein